MICISEYIYVSYRQSHEIVVFFDNLRSFLNFLLSSFAFDFIFDLLGVDQSRTSEDIIFRDVLLTLCLALLIFSFALFLQSLLFFLVLEGLLFFVLLFFFHDFQLILHSFHTLPLKLIVDKQQSFFEECEDVLIIDIFKVLICNFVSENFTYFFGKGGEVLFTFQNLIAGFNFFIGALVLCVYMLSGVLSKYCSNLSSLIIL